MAQPRHLILWLGLWSCLPTLTLAGTTVIQVETEGSGTIRKLSGETNHNGALVWDGSQWVVNSTWAHKYFVDPRTGARLKTYKTDSLFQGNTPETLNPEPGTFTITRSLYTYQKTTPLGVYTFQATQYRVQDKVSGKAFILRSRGTGRGKAPAYFDIYIQNEAGSDITAIRGDPAWFTYSGPLESALPHTSPTANKTGDFLGATTASPPSLYGNYFLDIGGGSDMGGKSYQFRTAPLNVESVELSLGGYFAIDFAVKWTDGSGELRAHRFLPWAEGTFTGAKSPLATVSAASFAVGEPVAGGLIAAGFGQNLTSDVIVAPPSGSLPTELGGISLRIRDSAGVERLCPLWFVSPSQINYFIREGTALGLAQVTVLRGNEEITRGALMLDRTAPGLFTMNTDGKGVPAALVIYGRADGSRSWSYVFNAGCAVGACQPVPIDLGAPGDVAYLQLYGTGIRGRSSLDKVFVRIGEDNYPVEYAGPVADMVGLDQVNCRLPRTLIGKGLVQLVLIVDGKTSNPVTIHIK